MSAPITLAAKDPNERLGYTWTPAEGDTIASGLSITVSDGTATIDGSPTQIEDDATAKFFLIGGDDGETTIITARATMASGDIIEQTILIPIRDSASSRAEVSLAMAKQHLRIRHNDEDALIADYIRTARAWMARYAGVNDDPAAPELKLAELMLVASFYEDREGTAAALANGVPRGIAHLVVPFRQGGYA